MLIMHFRCVAFAELDDLDDLVHRCSTERLVVFSDAFSSNGRAGDTEARRLQLPRFANNTSASTSQSVSHSLLLQLSTRHGRRFRPLFSSSASFSSSSLPALLSVVASRRCQPRRLFPFTPVANETERRRRRRRLSKKQFSPFHRYGFPSIAWPRPSEQLQERANRAFR